MSMIYCLECDSHIDTDFEECHEWKGDLICEHCHVNLEYMTELALVEMVQSYEHTKKLSEGYRI